MPLSVLDLYRKVLPKTNCGKCGFPTCLAFAGMVVSEGLSLEKCPYIDPATLSEARVELDKQRREGKWTKKDLAEDALNWARQRAASMDMREIHSRIGGLLSEEDGEESLELPYFQDTAILSKKGLRLKSGKGMSRWEQVFIYNHMAQGGERTPTGIWKGFVELPNTVSKMKTMEGAIERPLSEHFKGKKDRLLEAALKMGGIPAPSSLSNADAAILFRPLPRIPVMLLFWDEDTSGEYPAQVKLLFDETVQEHLDIESILFLSERIKQMLCGEDPPH